jgi:hypothetical protein
MTEDEAKTKWCHKLLQFKTANPEANWGWDGKCMGSACMAWRWAKVERNLGVNHGYERVITDSGINGYCGLAGKP